MVVRIDQRRVAAAQRPTALSAAFANTRSYNVQDPPPVIEGASKLDFFHRARSLGRDWQSQRRFETAFLPRGDGGLLEIKFALDTAARFISDFTFPQQLIDVLALGVN